MMSLEPPAAKLTTNLTGRFGYFSCAAAGSAAQSKAKATQNRMMRMATLPVRFAWCGLGELSFALLCRFPLLSFLSCSPDERSEIRDCSTRQNGPGFRFAHPGYKLRQADRKSTRLN